MSYVKVPEAALVVGQEYVLTHVGCAPVTGQAAVYEQRRVPVYPGAGAMVNRTIERCTRVETPPTSKQALENAYKTWKRLNAPDVLFRGFGSRRNRVNHGVTENEYRKRAFYAGRNRHGGHIFTQERSFGSKKAVAFVPVNPAETRTRQYYNTTKRGMVNIQDPVYPFGLDLSPTGTWLAWTLDEGEEEDAVLGPENNVAPGANAAAAAAAAANARLMARGPPPSPLRRGSAQAPAPAAAEGNLLGLNNKPFGLNNKRAMANANANTKKARNAWLKSKNQEAELRGLFGGAKTRRNRRY